MGLATEIVGPGILTSIDVSVRVWRVYGYEQVAVYNESTKEEAREWVALTKTIAQETAEAASQEGLPAGAVASYSATEDQRVVGSYKLVKNITYAPVITLTWEDYP